MTTTDGNQYSLMQGVIKVLMCESIFISFVICGCSAWWVRVRWLASINYPGHPAQSLLACAAPLLILVRANLHQGKGDSLVVLLRIKRKLMNIDCHLLKPCTTMTAQWGLLSPQQLVSSVLLSPLVSPFSSHVSLFSLFRSQNKSKTKSNSSNANPTTHLSS